MADAVEDDGPAVSKDASEAATEVEPTAQEGQLGSPTGGDTPAAQDTPTDAIKDAAATEDNGDASNEADKPAEQDAAGQPDGASASADKPAPNATAPATPETKKKAAARKLRSDEAKEGIQAVDANKSATELQADASTVLADYLTKRSDTGFVHSWKKRWVMLVGNLLYYFEKEDSKTPKGVILLDGATVDCAPQKGFKGQECLVIKTKANRTFYLYGSQAQNSTWTAAIKAVPGVTQAAAAPAAAEGTEKPAVATEGSGETPSGESGASAGDGEISPRTAVAIAEAAAEAAPSSDSTAAAGEGAGAASGGSEGAAAGSGSSAAGAGESSTPEFGVTDTVNAIMSDLPPEVQVVWVTVLSAATRAKELESQLAEAQSRASRAEAKAVSAAHDAMTARADEDMQATFSRAKADVESEAHARIKVAVAEATAAAESRVADQWRESLDKVRAEEAEKRKALEAKLVADAVPTAVAEATTSKDAEIAVLRQQLEELRATATEAAAVRDAAAAAHDSEAAAALAELREQLANAVTKLELARIEAETLRQELTNVKTRAAAGEKDLKAAEARADSATTDAAQEYVKRVNIEREVAKLRAQLSSAQSKAVDADGTAAEMASAKSAVSAARADADKAAATVSGLQAEIASLRAEVTSARGEAAKAAEALRAEQASSVKTLEEANNTADNERTRSAVLKEALLEAQSEAFKYQTQATEKEAHVNDLQGQLTRAQKQVAELQALSDSVQQNAAGMVPASSLEAAQVAREAAVAEAAAAATALEAERQRTAAVTAQLAATKDELAQAEKQLSEALAAKDSIAAELATAQASSGGAAEAAAADVQRVSKNLSSVIGLLKEILGAGPDTPVVSASGNVDLFALRDAVKSALDVKQSAAAESERASNAFTKAALEKKVSALEEQLKHAEEDKAGLTKELDDYEAAEARLKEDATSWMGRARELEGQLREASDRVARLADREHQLELALADAKAKLYNTGKA